MLVNRAANCIYTDDMAVPAIILAAGASRRLGRPKQLVHMARETLLGRTIRVVSEAGAKPIVVVLGAHREAIEAGVDLTGVEVVFNCDWEQGIASSIRAGLEAVGALGSGISGVLLLACDQPALTAAHLRKLISLHESASRNAGSVTVASAYAGVAGIPAIFPASRFPGLLELTGDTGARHLLRESAREVVCEPFVGGDADIDTPRDIGALSALERE